MKTGSALSTTACVKEIIREYMAGHDSADRKDIVACVKEKMAGNEFLTDGVIAGAIKIMVASCELEVVARGKYQRGTGRHSDKMVFEKVYALCERFGHELDRVCTVNMMTLTDKEKEIYPEFSELLLAGKGCVMDMVEGLGSLLDKIKTVAEENSQPDGGSAAVPEMRVQADPQGSALSDNDSNSETASVEPVPVETAGDNSGTAASVDGAAASEDKEAASGNGKKGRKRR